MDVVYLDSSALVKLVLPEAETVRLLESLSRWRHHASSQLALVEVLRATRRTSPDPTVLTRAREVLAGLDLIELTQEVLDDDATLEPTSLRSLDALHLASARYLGTALDSMIIYDRTLAAAARGLGLSVLAPK